MEHSVNNSGNNSGRKRPNNVQRELLAIERFFPHHWRERAEQTLFALSIFFLSFAVLFNIVIDTRFGFLWHAAEGLFLISFALLLKTILIEIYFNNLRMRLEEEHGMSFAALLVIGLHHPEKKDLAKAFFYSRLGREVAMRLGIAKEVIHHFLHTKNSAAIALPTAGHMPALAGLLHDEDPYFRDFLDRVHVSRDLLMQSSMHVEKKHRQHLAYRPLLSHAFRKEEVPVFSLEHVARKEVDELERFYRIIITEQATQQIVSHFREDMLRFVSESERTNFLTELIETSLSAHKERFHGASVIMPADVRNFLIHKKALK